MRETPTIKPRTNGPLSCDELSVAEGSPGWQRVPNGGDDRAVPLWRVEEQAVLRWDARQDRIPGEKSPDRVLDKRKDYFGKELTVHDNRGICAHAAHCTDTLKTVFKYGQEPWIDPNGDTVDKIVATVQQCPSGALSYSIEGVEHRDREGDPTILIAPNGPYSIKGGAQLDDVEWGAGASHEHFDLCRCGQSTNKPFCSGAHWNHHFDEYASRKE